ncbi:MFS transporter, partial [Caballeronia mineralivorans]|uniref:MFS transporter n=1 Tax=Caballeronia mineralivorans TaxID=2010198 RepID=UPI000AE56E6B
MNPSAADAAPAGTGASGARPATIMVAVASGFVMAMLDVTIVNVALKAMQDSLSLSLTTLVWVVDAYTLSFAALLLLGGALADRFGSKTIYLTGLVIFVAASLLCAAATTSAMLIAARLLQGVGAALFMPSSLSLLTLAFPPGALRVRMIGIWGALVSAAMAFGPFVGGVLVNAIGWRSIFWVNLPVGLIGLWLTHRHVARSPRHAGPLNGFGHLFGAAALTALSLTLIQRRLDFAGDRGLRTRDAPRARRVRRARAARAPPDLVDSPPQQPAIRGGQHPRTRDQFRDPRRDFSGQPLPAATTRRDSAADGLPSVSANGDVRRRQSRL